MARIALQKSARRPALFLPGAKDRAGASELGRLVCGATCLNRGGFLQSIVMVCGQPNKSFHATAQARFLLAGCWPRKWFKIGLIGAAKLGYD